MGFGFNFLFKKKGEMQELMNEDNIALDGNAECTEFISLSGGNPEYIYCEEYSLKSSNNAKFVEELAVRSGVGREQAKEYGENSFLCPKIYMDTKGNFEFVLEFDFETEYNWIMTEKEREMLVNKAKEHFNDCFGVDLMKLPELVKGCSNKEQLFDKFEIEKSKGIEKIAEAYGFEKMRVTLFSTERLNQKNEVLTCIFNPDLKTSMELRKEAGLQGKGNVECTAKFDNHLEMKLEVNDGDEKKTIVPKRSLEKEIRAGISAMYEKKAGYSLAEYMDRNCPSVLYKKPSLDDMKYYCKEMRKQKFFNEEMTPDFYNEERLTDWAVELLYSYEKYSLSPEMFHREFDYYKYPDTETRFKLLKQLEDYKADYERMLENKKNGLYDNIVEISDEEIPF